MRVVRGRFAEARGYLAYCAAIFLPGRPVPVFWDMVGFSGELGSLGTEELKLALEEFRRQIDRQMADLERIRTRGATLVTVSLAEIALLSSGARNALGSCWLVIGGWSLSAALVLAGLGGAAAILTARAEMGRTDTHSLLERGRLNTTSLVRDYAEVVYIGEATVAARITVLRDAVLLLILGGVGYAVTWPFIP